MSDLDRARARTFALRLAYGPQSNLDNAVREDFSKTLAKVGTPQEAQERARLLALLPFTGYGRTRRDLILRDYLRLRS